MTLPVRSLRPQALTRARCRAWCVATASASSAAANCVPPTQRAKASKCSTRKFYFFLSSFSFQFPNHPSRCFVLRRPRQHWPSSISSRLLAPIVIYADACSTYTNRMRVYVSHYVCRCGISDCYAYHQITSKSTFTPQPNSYSFAWSGARPPARHNTSAACASPSWNVGFPFSWQCKVVGVAAAPGPPPAVPAGPTPGLPTKTSWSLGSSHVISNGTGWSEVGNFTKADAAKAAKWSNVAGRTPTPLSPWQPRICSRTLMGVGAHYQHSLGAAVLLPSISADVLHALLIVVSKAITRLGVATLPVDPPPPLSNRDSAREHGWGGGSTPSVFLHHPISVLSGRQSC